MDRAIGQRTAINNLWLLFYSSVPIFGEQMYSVNGLQKVCDVLLENPSWSIAHLIANFNLTEYINNPRVLELIDEPDYTNQMTPIQVWSQVTSHTGVT